MYTCIRFTSHLTFDYVQHNRCITLKFAMTLKWNDANKMYSLLLQFITHTFDANRSHRTHTDIFNDTNQRSFVRRLVCLIVDII